MVNMEIENLIFFDVETTGLFDEDTPENPVKIAELSMIAVETKYFLQSDGKFENWPCSKLQLCINPVSKFTEKASRINGLTNDMLSTCRPFSTSTNVLIRTVFDRFVPDFDPQLNRTCLIGHFEGGFGFHLLKREVNDPALTRNISCFNTFEYSDLAFECSAQSLESTYEEKFGTRPTELNNAEADATNLIKIARMNPSKFVGAMQSFKRYLKDI